MNILMNKGEEHSFIRSFVVPSLSHHQLGRLSFLARVSVPFSSLAMVISRPKAINKKAKEGASHLFTLVVVNKEASHLRPRPIFVLLSRDASGSLSLFLARHLSGK